MNGLRILVAEDDERIRQGLVDALESEGYLVLAAENGVSALVLYQQERPDLLRLDVMMPRLDGFGVLSQLRSSPGTADIPVIILTSKMLTAAEKAISINLTHREESKLERQSIDG